MRVVIEWKDENKQTMGGFNAKVEDLKQAEGLINAFVFLVSPKDYLHYEVWHGYPGNDRELLLIVGYKHAGYEMRRTLPLSRPD